MSLDQYARILGLHPLHFNGVYSTTSRYVADENTFWHQEAWMSSGRVSREELGQALATAEALIAERLGYWPAPTWVEDEPHAVPHRSGIPSPDWFAVGLDGYATLVRQAPTAKTNWAKIQAVGRKVVDLVAKSVKVVYTDENDDGFAETATVPVSGSGIVTTGWETTEIAVYPAGWEDITLQDQIRPLTVDMTSTSLTITGRAEQFVDPDLWYEHHPQGLDGDDPSTFLKAVDVYRIYTSSEDAHNAPAIYRWPVTTPVFGYQTQTGMALIRDGERGILAVIPANWDATLGGWTKAQLLAVPEQVLLYYFAGHPVDASGQVTPPMARIVASLATALITKPLHGYGPPEARNLMDYWQAIPEEASYDQERCPWGMRMGAWEAYSTVQRLMGFTGSSV